MSNSFSFSKSDADTGNFYITAPIFAASFFENQTWEQEIELELTKITSTLHRGAAPAQLRLRSAHRLKLILGMIGVSFDCEIASGS
jgi:hypothetical protein